jgi:hypothetical protein
MFLRATQCVRGVLDPPVSAFSLSLYRHPFLYTLFSSRFTLIINNNNNNLSVYDSSDSASEPTLSPSHPSSLPHMHIIQSHTLPTPTLLTFTYTHDWTVDQIPDLFRVTDKGKTRQVSRNRGQKCGDIEFPGYLVNATGPVSLVLDLLIVHECWGSSSDPTLNGNLHYPHDIDRSLNETTDDIQ